MGDISSQLELRDRLKCQDFNWYIKNVYPEVFIPSESPHRGSITSDAILGYCLDTVMRKAHDEPVRYNKCLTTTSRLTQTWYLTELGEMRSGYNCLDVGMDLTFKTITMGACHGLKGNQHWMYRNDRTIYQDNSDSCLTVDLYVMTITIQECTGASTQKWTWRPYSTSH